MQPAQVRGMRVEIGDPPVLRERASSTLPPSSAASSRFVPPSSAGDPAVVGVAHAAEAVHRDDDVDVREERAQRRRTARGRSGATGRASAGRRAARPRRTTRPTRPRPPARSPRCPARARRATRRNPNDEPEHAAFLDSRRREQLVEHRAPSIGRGQLLTSRSRNGVSFADRAPSAGRARARR